MATQRKPKTDKAAAQPESVEQTSPPPPPPKKRGKLLIIAGGLLLAVAGGGTAFYFMQPSDSAAHAVAVPKPPVFLPLEAFTVNLASDGSSMQFMQAGVTLKLSEKATADLIKERLPEVRNTMLLALSAKKASEILTVSGKQKLAGEMSEAIRKVIAGSPAATVAAAKPATAEKGDQGTAKAEDKPAAASGAPAAPEIEVLFTSFIIQ